MNKVINKKKKEIVNFLKIKNHRIISGLKACAKIYQCKKKYQEIFIKSLAINEKNFNEDIKYNDVPEWDSIGHMTLISDLEDGFEINIETDDIVDFSSFKKGIEILEKYKIVI